MNNDIKQIQGIKRPYEANAAASVGYQPVAKKKKGIWPDEGSTSADRFLA